MKMKTIQGFKCLEFKQKMQSIVQDELKGLTNREKIERISKLAKPLSSKKKNTKRQSLVHAK
jgi:hypothetical protein